ncbi:MAG: helix-turn-helix domain-containing protein [Actinophytocola sp.]|uniref:helix-turn-helix domain-containing protein n=1 Tax=Actinophytocola sp. TaxID=1872138 RepID=UPI00132298B6|nr:helix-turn-helix transcriptional regulator [Actinophytocola sp.]MPZ86282.1 helix-turn-helix domain-containing protein [Actinophytocola sp.]
MSDGPAEFAEGGSAAVALTPAIRRLRAAANLSHAEIARRIGYSPAHVSRAECDDAGLPSADLVRALDRGLGARGGTCQDF